MTSFTVSDGSSDRTSGQMQQVLSVFSSHKNQPVKNDLILKLRKQENDVYLTAGVHDTVVYAS